MSWVLSEKKKKKNEKMIIIGPIYSRANLVETWKFGRVFLLGVLEANAGPRQQIYPKENRLKIAILKMPSLTAPRPSPNADNMEEIASIPRPSQFSH